MNLLTIIAAVILIWFAILGIKKGFVEGLGTILSYIIAIMVIYIVVKGIGNFAQKSYLNVLIALILLVAIRIINRVIKLIIDSLKLAVKLPIVSWLNHLLGIILGLFRGCLLIWLLFIIIGYFNIIGINAWIVDQVTQNVFLTTIYKTNLFVTLLKLIQ